jgi:hypothetical protein
MCGWALKSKPASESHGVAREDFLKNYIGSGLDPRWLKRRESGRPKHAAHCQGSPSSMPDRP